MCIRETLLLYKSRTLPLPSNSSPGYIKVIDTIPIFICYVDEHLGELNNSIATVRVLVQIQQIAFEHSWYLETRK